MKQKDKGSRMGDAKKNQIEHTDPEYVLGSDRKTTNKYVICKQKKIII